MNGCNKQQMCHRLQENQLFLAVDKQQMHKMCQYYYRLQWLLRLPMDILTLTYNNIYNDKRDFNSEDGKLYLILTAF